MTLVQRTYPLLVKATARKALEEGKLTDEQYRHIIFTIDDAERQLAEMEQSRGEFIKEKLMEALTPT